MTYEAFVELVARMRQHQITADVTRYQLERSVDNAIDAHRQSRPRLYDPDASGVLTMPGVHPYGHWLDD